MVMSGVTRWVYSWVSGVNGWSRTVGQIGEHRLDPGLVVDGADSVAVCAQAVHHVAEQRRAGIDQVVGLALRRLIQSKVDDGARRVVDRYQVQRQVEVGGQLELGDDAEQLAQRHSAAPDESLGVTGDLMWPVDHHRQAGCRPRRAPLPRRPTCFPSSPCRAARRCPAGCPR